MSLYTINLGSCLSRSAQKHPDRLALVSPKGKQLTYRQLESLSNRLAHGLMRQGVKQGDHIATMTPNNNELIIAIYAIFKIGAVLVPINARYIASEIAWILDHSDAKALIYASQFEDPINSVRADLPKLDLLLRMDGQEGGGALGLNQLLVQGEDPPVGSQVLADDLAMLIYTSGTTGKPKGVMITHNSALWNMVNWTHAGTYREGDRVLQYFPMYHVAAIKNLLIYIYLGGTIFLRAVFDPTECMETIEREKITRWAAAPTVFHSLLQLPDIENYDTSSMTLLGSGASIMPVETRRRLQKVFPNARMFDNYGMTEASGGIATLSPDDSHRKVACVGTPLVSLELRVVDPYENDVATGDVGEVIFRGNNLMKGYYKDPEATAFAIRGGWMHTEDLGKLDEEGFLYLVDRSKDMIITGGENVFSREVEEVLICHNQVAEAAVIGVPHPKWGEAIKAVVTIKKGQQTSAEEIIAYCRQRLAGFKCPKSLEIVEALPKNASGKILKRTLREQFSKSLA